MPSSVPLLDVLGAPGLTPDQVLEWWASPLPGLTGEIGADAAGAVVLDLEKDGPHGLVAGTTGAGKSEFLRTLVAGLVLRHGPERVNFILVDYKGGAAFEDCVKPAAHRRLRHQPRRPPGAPGENVARGRGQAAPEDPEEWGAEDMADMRAKAPDDVPPALVIIVDEYRYLKQEVPAFVDLAVDVAGLGRSLGIHVILATQSPEGIVSKDIDRNSDLRVALRLVDAAESMTLVGSPDAAGLPGNIPGRAYIKTRQSKVATLFQSAYVAGVTRPSADVQAASADAFVFTSAAHRTILGDRERRPGRPEGPAAHRGHGEGCPCSDRRTGALPSVA